MKQSEMTLLLRDMNAESLDVLLALANERKARLLEQPKIDAVTVCKDSIGRTTQNYEMGLIDYNEYLLQVFDSIKLARKA